MKKMISLLSLLLCVVMLASCGTSNQQTVAPKDSVTDAEPLPYMSAVWTEYDKMPFPEFLETAIKNMPAELGVIESYEVTAAAGWSELMDNVPLEPAEGTVPVTYTFVAEASEGGSETEKGTIEFAVCLDEATNTFEIECVFLDGEFLPSQSIEPGMEALRFLADGEAHKIYEMEILSPKFTSEG